MIPFILDPSALKKSLICRSIIPHSGIGDLALVTYTHVDGKRYKHALLLNLFADSWYIPPTRFLFILLGPNRSVQDDASFLQHSLSLCAETTNVLWASFNGRSCSVEIGNEIGQVHRD